jgi:hypothetical protein
MEGEAPSPRDAIRRLGQTWRIVLASGLLIALLSFLLNLKSLYDGQSFLAGIDAKNLNMVYTGLMCAAIALSLFFTLRMSFISAIPMVEGLGFIESIKRSNSLITGNTGYMFLLWCVFILFAVPGVFIGTFLNSNFIEYTLAQVEADLANKTSQVVLELGMPWTPLGIAGYMLNMIFLLYSTVTTAALYQHLRKLKSA